MKKLNDTASQLRDVLRANGVTNEKAIRRMVRYMRYAPKRPRPQLPTAYLVIGFLADSPMP